MLRISVGSIFVTFLCCLFVCLFVWLVGFVLFCFVCLFIVWFHWLWLQTSLQDGLFTSNDGVNTPSYGHSHGEIVIRFHGNLGVSYWYQKVTLKAEVAHIDIYESPLFDVWFHNITYCFSESLITRSLVFDFRAIHCWGRAIFSNRLLHQGGAEWRCRNDSDDVHRFIFQCVILDLSCPSSSFHHQSLGPLQHRVCLNM